jgi:Helitron helicase-like domain at N-terminus
MGDHDEHINLKNHGSHIVLLSTHIGSKHHMNQLFQDSMAICWAFNKPDIFLTMTANPHWPEIQNALLEEEPQEGGPCTGHRKKQAAHDRPDIVRKCYNFSSIFAYYVTHINPINARYLLKSCVCAPTSAFATHGNYSSHAHSHIVVYKYVHTCTHVSP